MRMGERRSGQVGPLAAGLVSVSLLLGSGAAFADSDPPKSGGTLEIVTVYPTLAALSWDLASVG